jgi:predicted enzyme related to lactoylglutathione lyase
MGAYVVADDLDRSAGFYTALFGRQPQVRTPGLVGFDVAGGLYAVVSKAAYAAGATRGGNVAPYLKVADIDAWFRHVQAVAAQGLVTKTVVREGPFALIKIADPDGNVLELYSVTPAAKP